MLLERVIMCGLVQPACRALQLVLVRACVGKAQNQQQNQPNFSNIWFGGDTVSWVDVVAVWRQQSLKSTGLYNKRAVIVTPFHDFFESKANPVVVLDHGKLQQ